MAWHGSSCGPAQVPSARDLQAQVGSPLHTGHIHVVDIMRGARRALGALEGTPRTGSCPSLPGRDLWVGFLRAAVGALPLGATVYTAARLSSRTQVSVSVPARNHFLLLGLDGPNNAPLLGAEESEQKVKGGCGGSIASLLGMHTWRRQL